MAILPYSMAQKWQQQDTQKEKEKSPKCYVSIFLATCWYNFVFKHIQIYQKWPQQDTQNEKDNALNAPYRCL